MCGVVGFWRCKLGTASSDSLMSSVRHMADQSIARGPDDAGGWVDELLGIALAHRRLAVLDLSNAGHQPMHSPSGRFVISFNGEIYNHLDIRRQIEQIVGPRAWVGRSDTETLLNAIEEWGIESSLKRCIGMFAFALWDRVSHVLYLARDRVGEKPLFYGWTGSGDERAFIFASELKAIRAYPHFDSSISRAALAQYLRFTCIPAPHSIYEGVFKLEPGCLLTIRGNPDTAGPFDPCRHIHRCDQIELKGWWSLEEEVNRGQKQQITDEAIAVGKLERVLSNSVERQSLADVPLGAFLSGGVDSSTIVALMQNQASQRVKTFTIGFDEVGFDESPYALSVAEHLGTDHYEIRVSPNMARDIIPSLPWIYDEPFADSSQIPTHIVCKSARQQLTVALSGDGGDELFGGYGRYFWGPTMWRKFSWLPFSLRRILARSVCAVSVEHWDKLTNVSGVPRFGDRAHKLCSRVGSTRTIDELHWNLVSEWDPAFVVKGIYQVSPSSWESNNALPAGLNPVERMMFRDTVTYLPDDILCKVDRAAMACSLETRAPFLDHEVVEFAWRLPINMKIRGGMGKWALRQVLYKYVPKELIERPKAGFAIPIGQWLRGPLRDWAESLLGESRLHQEGYFHPQPIRKAWAEHLTGRCDHTPKIWTILMFQAWLEQQRT